MENSHPSDGCWRVWVMRMVSLLRSVAESWARRLCSLLGKMRSGITVVWRVAVNCWQSIRSRQRYLQTWGQCRSRSLHAWRVALGVRLDVNPVWVGLIVTISLLFAMFLVMVLLRGVGFENWDFLLIKQLIELVNLWRSAVQHRILNDGTQSPIGDYLALGVVVTLLTEMVERLLHGISDFAQETLRGRLASLVRGIGVAIFLQMNFALTSLISYGFLCPLPPEQPIRILYVGLMFFMFTVGVWRSMLGVRRAFPVRPELIREAAVRRRERASKLSKKIRQRKRAMNVKIVDREEIFRGWVAPNSLETNSYRWDLYFWADLLMLWLNVGRRVRRFRATEPRHTLLHQVVFSLVVRIVFGCLAVGAVWVAQYGHRQILSARMVVVWGICLFSVGVIDSVSIPAGAFRVGSPTKWAATGVAIMLDMIVILSMLSSVAKNKVFWNDISVLSHYPTVLVGGVILLFIVEVLCIHFTFEMRDFTLVALVRAKRSSVREADLLHGYLRKYVRSHRIS